MSIYLGHGPKLHNLLGPNTETIHSDIQIQVQMFPLKSGLASAQTSYILYISLIAVKGA